MKTTLTFKLPTEEKQFNMAVNGYRAHDAIHYMLNMIRTKLKYGELSDEEYHAVERIQADMLETLKVYGVNLYD